MQICLRSAPLLHLRVSLGQAAEQAVVQPRAPGLCIDHQRRQLIVVPHQHERPRLATAAFV